MKHNMRNVLAGICLLGFSCSAYDNGSELGQESVATTEDALSAGTIQGDEFLFQGQRLNAPGRCYNLQMQRDGNLVSYNNSGRALWASSTNGTPWSSEAFAVLQGDGNFVVRSGSGRPLWATATDGNPGNRLVVQDDGNTVIYFGTISSQVLWASDTNVGVRTNCSSGPSDVTRVSSNVDLPGSDLPGMPLTDLFYYAQCGKACAANASCQSWTWVPQTIYGQCWLKSSVPRGISSTGLISGVRERL